MHVLLISREGTKIRLTRERIHHILEHHPEMKLRGSEMSEVILNPDLIIKGARGEKIALKQYDGYHIVVIYKEELNEGFIITAFITTNVGYYLRKEILWKKQ